MTTRRSPTWARPRPTWTTCWPCSTTPSSSTPVIPAGCYGRWPRRGAGPSGGRREPLDRCGGRPGTARRPGGHRRLGQRHRGCARPPRRRPGRRARLAHVGAASVGRPGRRAARREHGRPSPAGGHAASRGRPSRDERRGGQSRGFACGRGGRPGHPGADRTAGAPAGGPVDHADPVAARRPRAGRGHDHRRRARRCRRQPGRRGCGLPPGYRRVRQRGQAAGRGDHRERPAGGRVRPAVRAGRPLDGRLPRAHGRYRRRRARACPTTWPRPARCSRSPRAVRPSSRSDDFYRDRPTSTDAPTTAADPARIRGGGIPGRPSVARIRAALRPSDGSELYDIAASRAAGALDDIAAARGIISSRPDLPGRSPLARFAAATAFGDFTAAYAGIGRGVDPGAVRAGEMPF